MSFSSITVLFLRNSMETICKKNCAWTRESSWSGWVTVFKYKLTLAAISIYLVNL